MDMSTEELFIQQFAKLFIHYRDALTLDAGGEHGKELERLNETPVVELDRMVSAARLALLEIESRAREQDDARRYYAKPDEAECESHRARGA